MIAKVKSNYLRNALKSVIPFASTDEIRPNLMHICFDASVSADGVGRLTVAAADGFRMGVVEMPAQVDEAFQLLIPASDIRGFTQGGQVGDLTGLDFIIEGKEYDPKDVRFPNYKAIIPKNYKADFILPKGFPQAISYLREVARPLYRLRGNIQPVYWHISKAGHVIELVVDDGLDESLDSFSVRYDFVTQKSPLPDPADETDNALTISADVRFCDRVLQAAGPELLNVKVSAPNAPILFYKEDPELNIQSKWVLMPTLHEKSKTIKRPEGR